MPLTILNPSQLKSSEVAAQAAFLSSFVADNYPALDLSPASVIYRQVILPAAMMAAAQAQERALLVGSSSIYTAITQPSNVDSTTLDRLLANYLTTRMAGAVAGGQVLIVVDQPTPTIISPNVTFTSGSQTFVPTQTFYGVPNTTGIGAVVPSLMTPYGANQYAFTIEVVATAAGAAGNMSRGTSLAVSSVQSISSAIVASDFSGGTDTETDQQVLVRCLNGITAQGMTSRQSIKATLQAKFPQISDVSVLGTGDSELVRGAQQVFGLPLTGRSDIYVRTAPAPITLTVAKPTTYQGNGTWTTTFTRDQYPGMLYVANAQSIDGQTTYAISNVQRMLDASPIAGLDGAPSMRPDSPDYVFSRYQYVVVTIDQPGSGFYAGSTVEVPVGTALTLNYDVTYFPAIDAVSDFSLTRANRPPAGDILVRAVSPCMVSVSVNILQKVTDAAVDTGAVTAAIVAAINTTPMSEGRLLSTRIIQAIDTTIGGTSRVLTPLDVRGRILTPDVSYTPESMLGTPAVDGETWLFGPNQLKVVPKGPISPRTVAFTCTPSAVAVNIVPDTSATSI